MRAPVESLHATGRPRAGRAAALLRWILFVGAAVAGCFGPNVVTAAGPPVRRYLPHAQPTPPGPTGPYLGQTPPGMVPEVFAPGIVTLPGTYTGGITFSPGGDEIYFGRFTAADMTNSVWVTRQVDGVWTAPAPFVPCLGASGQFLTPDGHRIYYLSPLGVLNSQIYFIDRLDAGWSSPTKLQAPFSSRPKASVSAAASGNLYFSQIETSMQGRFYVARRSGGGFAAPVALPPTINRFITNDSIFVAPDESYLVLGVVPAPDIQRLYVSFRGTDGTWGAPIELGSQVNSTNDLIGASVSPDGKYLFFTRNARASSGIYWVDARVVLELKPAERG